MLRQMVGRHLHFTASVMQRVLQSPSLKSTITSLVDTLTCLGLVSIIELEHEFLTIFNATISWIGMAVCELDR